MWVLLWVYKIPIMASIIFKLINKSIFYRYRNGRKLDVTRKLPYEINHKDWSIAKQQFKNNPFLNKELNNFIAYLIDQTNISKSKKEVINLVWLKRKQEKYFKPKNENQKLKADEPTLLEYIDIYKITLPLPMVKKLDTLKKKIAKLPKVKIKDVDINWLNNYSEMLLSKGYAESYINKHAQLIKRIIQFAEINDQTVKRNIYNFKTLRTSTISYHLNEDELGLLFKLKLANSPLENIRKLFLIGCHTGLRVSDLMRINTFTITDNMIELQTQKTRQNIIIPIPNGIMEFINDVYPIAPQVFNRGIKIICKEAGILEKVKGYKQGKRNKRIIGTYSKYELISSHCMRRSFCTNLYTKIPTPIIMAVSGHKTEKSFLIYIKKPQRDFAEQLKNYYNSTYKTV